MSDQHDIDMQIASLLSLIPEIDQRRLDWLQLVHLAFKSKYTPEPQRSMLYRELDQPEKYSPPPDFFNQLCTLYLYASAESRTQIRAAFKDKEGACEQLYNYYWQLAENETSPLDTSKVQRVFAAASIENLEPTDYYHAPWIISELCAQAQRADIDFLPVIDNIIRISDSPGKKLFAQVLQLFHDAE